jgi:hypothetical protein
MGLFDRVTFPTNMIFNISSNIEMKLSGSADVGEIQQKNCETTQPIAKKATKKEELCCAN